MPSGATLTRRSFLVGTTAALAALGLSACGSGPQADPNDPLRATLNGSGATFPKTFYEVAAYEFMKRHRNVTMTYAGGGSGKGRTDLQEQVVDWAGSDGIVKDADKAKFRGGPFLYFPSVIAPITVAYNLSGVRDLKLSPATIAKIFQRDIARWDDPAIVAENPQYAGRLKGEITVARRSDGSGTTENFTKFLEKAVGARAGNVWRLTFGSTVDWPSDTQAGNGNAGVSQIVQETRGAIGYVDYSDAVATELRLAAVQNRAGVYVEPTLDAASAAADGAAIEDDLTYDPLWADGPASYPITAPTWIIVYERQSDTKKAEALRAFLRYVLTDAQQIADTVDYAPIPARLAARAVAQLDRITTT
jgi:phosphate transport system substrate-binding protein